MKRNYKLPSTYHLGSPGNACAGDPPGHPRYFVRAIYTRYGNSPRYGTPQYYLNGTGFEELEEVDKLYGTARFPKLPLDHPRTRAWILDKYRHHHHCYYHPTEKEYRSRKTVIFPVPNYKLESFRDHEGYSEEYRTKQRAAIDQRNADIRAEAAIICIPENHQAVVLIREYYPEYEPELDLIENPPRSTETWWETLDEQPTPENCPGTRWGSKHPVNGAWCQVCGWHQEEKGADNK
jgi:hypothetical protein